MEAALLEVIASALHAAVISHAPVSGGDVAESFRLELDDGRTVFAKTHRTATPDFFETEALGLTWLAEANEVAVPEVLHVGEERPLLVLEWIDESAGGPVDDVGFGRALARLHAKGAPMFGRSDRRTTGSRKLPNEPGDNWAEFYAQNRLLPLARMASDEGALPADVITGLESVATRLANVGGSDEGPAFLHGDLWAGNRLVDRDGQNWLIDPAVHGGHREFDLAMMALFGGWAPECFAAYDDECPLVDGWRDRVPLHQLAPLAVHAIKFGGGYVPATAAALDRALALA